MISRALPVPLGLQVMALLGAVVGITGLPVLLRPDSVRRALGLRATPQMVYILRIVGTMLTALGLILLVLAFTFWSTAA
jgi:hypothetical protein